MPQTYRVAVYVAGDIGSIKAVLREECYEHGLCVTVEPTLFIYTGGEELGAVVGLVNYPRFPSSRRALFGRATALAKKLVTRCNQRTALVVGDDKTEWINIRPPGAQ